MYFNRVRTCTTCLPNSLQEWSCGIPCDLQGSVSHRSLVVLYASSRRPPLPLHIHSLSVLYLGSARAVHAHGRWISDLSPDEELRHSPYYFASTRKFGLPCFIYVTKQTKRYKMKAKSATDYLETDVYERLSLCVCRYKLCGCRQ